MFFKAKLAADFEKNLVSLESFYVLNSKFPEKVSAQNLIDLYAVVENEMMSSEITNTIDELKASISDIGVVVNGDKGLKNDPPQIFYRDKSTVLVSIDGEPKFKATEDKSVEFVANTPFLLAKEKVKSTYYLKGGDFWYQSTTIEGDWTNVDKAPKSIESFAVQNKSESTETPDSLGDNIPAIIVVTIPSELLVVNGDPEYSPIDSTQLLFIKNTESDILIDINTQKHFVLIAGRFYSSTSLKDGEWTFVEPKDLASDFAKIPESSDMASVKNNVPGTEEFQDALLEQSIPQTAAGDRTKTIEVTYDGDPQFQQISGT